jgi:hypothetical protein
VPSQSHHLTRICTLVFAAIAATGCSVSRTLATDELSRHAGDRPRTLQLFLSNGTTMTLTKAQIVGDTITGSDSSAQRVTVPLAQLYSVRLREIDPGLTVVTAALVVAAITGLSYVLMVAAYSGPGS